MANYENIRKVSYRNSKKDIIWLKQYIFILNTDTSEKYLLLKLLNNYKHKLKSFKLEITQFDKDKKLLEISTFNYDNLNIKKHKEFVPYTKILVNNSCESIEVRVISAVFDKVVYSDNRFKKIKKEKKEKKEKIETKIDDDNFKSKKLDLRSYLKVFVTAALSIVLALGFSAIIYASLEDYRSTITEFEDSNFEYIVTSRNKVQIEKFKGTTVDVVIPEKIYNYDIISISRTAFEDTKINSITINAYCGSISANTFSGQDELVSFTSDTIERIERNAFTGCTELVTLNVPNAVIVDYTLAECTKIESINFQNTSTGTSITTLFGYENTVPNTLTTVTINAGVVYSNFFTNARSIREVNFGNPNTYVEFGTLASCGLDNYYNTGNYEILNGTLVSIRNVNSVASLHYASIGRDITRVLGGVFRNANISELSLNLPGVELPSGLLSNCRYLRKVTIESNNVLPEGFFDNCVQLQEIEMPISGDSFSDLFTTDNCNVLKIVINGTRSIPKGYFTRISSLITLEVESTVPSISNNCIKNCQNLKELIVPNYGDNIKKYGDLGGVESITLTNLTNKYAIASETFSNLASLKSITFPTNIIEIESRAIVNCESLKTLVIPDNIQRMNFPIIGKNCPSLKNVTVPYVGERLESSGYYDEMNLSSNSTTTLTISNTSRAISNNIFKRTNTTLKKLILNGGIGTNGVLSNITGLSYLEINGSPKSFLGQLFTADSIAYASQGNYIPSTLKTVVVNASIGTGYFYGCSSIENVVLLYDYISSSSIFTGCTSLRNVYLGGSVTSDVISSLNSNSYQNNVNLILGSGLYYSIANSRITINQNVNYDSHSYDIMYNGIVYQYDGLLIYDLDDCMSDLIDNYKGTSFAYLDYFYSRTVDIPYFGSNNSTLYVRTETAYTISEYVNQPITARFYDQDNTLLRTETVDSESTLEYYIPTKEGYLFNGWYTLNASGNLSKFNFSGKLDSDIDLYANWVTPLTGWQVASIDSVIQISNVQFGTNQYVILPLADTEITISTSSMLDTKGYLYDSRMRLLADDDNSGSNYNFKITYKLSALNIYYINVSGVNEDENSAAYLVILGESDALSTLVAKESYVKQSEKKVAVGSNFSLSIPTKEGYTFMGWYTGKNGKGTRITNQYGAILISNINRNYDVYAYFVQNE